ncbi:zf-HC2 domain-containing protein [Kangiella shandongensis]|uniref:zf-HC2 domain-containing protein n=1 Tax=Kangiella shandongensis TaxID=2763258 RepID=UPI001CBBAA71|nr:zf-HC2 domain-containing protein [Kangiella shandongensis]
MLSCKQIVEHGSDYIEKDMGFWRKVEMKLHLMICVHCRRYVRQLKRTINMLSRGRYYAPSEEQVEQLKQQYQEVNGKR